MSDEKFLDRLLDRLTLECTPGSWAPRPVLSEDQWSVFKRLVSCLDDDEHVVLAGCALSAFFDPDKHAAGHAHDVKKMSVLFAIAHGREKTDVRPILFITDEESDRSGATEFLQVWGVAVLPFEPLLVPHDFVEKVISILNVGRNYSGDRRPINVMESKVANQIKIGVQDEYTLLHEVSAYRMMPEGVLTCNNELNESIRRLGPIDVVIHGQNPNRPVLCIEVDGQTHTEWRSVIKDSHKNRLLREIGLPVLRILPSDMALWRNSWRKEFYLYAKIISSWARVISRGMSESLVQDVEDDQFQRKFLRQREQLANAMFGGNYQDLSKDLQILVDDSDLLTELVADKYYSDLLRMESSSFYQEGMPHSLNKLPSRLSRHLGGVRIHGSIQSGVRTEAVFKHKGASENLQSATFFLVHPKLTEVESYEQLKNIALRHLYWLADQKVAEIRR
ncbi:DUF2726 domain-containing protein [Hydrogenophaga flava]|uniref:DUF2726 domain-containing protein n=1 Tax=Hydrogenophaga flava TaxID=65657 RepID=UPI000A95D6B7|nr:DUF2726 domain-containing protein [Hydrogenophaga flava]